VASFQNDKVEPVSKTSSVVALSITSGNKASGSFLNTLTVIYNEDAADKNFISENFHFFADRLKLITQELDGGTGRAKFQKNQSTDRY
jgi:hypothetical protein